MALSRGNKRTYVEARASTSSSSLSPVPSNSFPAKKPKRAETRQCPVCEEHIPLRLLPMHAALESERVEEVIQQVGSPDILYDEMDDAPGPSSRSRRSALKARKSLTSRNVHDSMEQACKTIQIIKRHRKQRHAKLKEIAREEEGYMGRGAWSRSVAGGHIVCPVCSLEVCGDQDVLDAHVDSCLANQTSRSEEVRRRELQQQRDTEEDIWDELDTGGHLGNIRGTGFLTRDRRAQDVDDDVDVEGDDQDRFGEAQFTEGDILPVDNPQLVVQEGIEVEIEGESEDEASRELKTLRDLVAEGKVVQRDRAEYLKAKVVGVLGVGEVDQVDRGVLTAKKRGDKAALVAALENKIEQLESMRVSSSTSLSCRICLDPYNEPTVSTGCWHTCCRECWLRCLGSTKLCPICKRITSATELRRVYL
ncbi:hypothetical protein K443DRAFT_675739 [Laccaria amethystina LaAM-08-1]|uniref:RING-type domain-containing protein n=1 Tax=Laccaria amethystina LaAM-08-1 TaxID=1095629 RepID=A0A0C9XSN8_9AGAR|nr:hypothetical protein K443DRAFT_675739 [Laccaria amethystina LaAM-08-1]